MRIIKALCVLGGLFVVGVAVAPYLLSTSPAEASNGHVCCLLGVCCPPPANEMTAGDAQTYELATLVQAQLGSFSATGEPSERAIAVAQAILKDFDLVPNGVGDAIVKGYAESFSHLSQK